MTRSTNPTVKSRPLGWESTAERRCADLSAAAWFLLGFLLEPVPLAPEAWVPRCSQRVTLETAASERSVSSAVFRVDIGASFHTAIFHAEMFPAGVFTRGYVPQDAGSAGRVLGLLIPSVWRHTPVGHRMTGHLDTI